MKHKPFRKKPLKAAYQQFLKKQEDQKYEAAFPKSVFEKVLRGIDDSGQILTGMDNSRKISQPIADIKEVKRMIAKLRKQFPILPTNQVRVHSLG